MRSRPDAALVAPRSPRCEIVSPTTLTVKSWGSLLRPAPGRCDGGQHVIRAAIPHQFALDGEAASAFAGRVGHDRRDIADFRFGDAPCVKDLGSILRSSASLTWALSLSCLRPLTIIRPITQRSIEAAQFRV